MHKEPLSATAVVVIPVLNEEACIQYCLEQWSQFNWDLLFVDGLSEDRTVEIIKAYQASASADGSSSRISIISPEKRQGLAHNTCLGLERALEAGYPHIIVADAGTQHPGDAWTMLRTISSRRGDRTIARGSYFLKGSRVHSFPLYRRVVTLGAALTAYVVLGKTGTYPTHAFKVWPQKALQEIPFIGLIDGTIARCENGPEFQVGMTWLSIKHNWRTLEFPMIFFGTKSTFRWRWIPRFMREVVRMRKYNPTLAH